MTRLRGWASKGERLVDKVPHGHWKTATFLAALRDDRIEALCLFDRPIATWTASELIKVACFRPNGVDFKLPELRDLLLRLAGEGGAVSGKRLGKFLSKISGRVVGGFRLEIKRDSSHGNRFSLRPAPQGGAHTDGGLGAIGGQFH